jgi:iron complex outermembrane receptor protein
MKVFPFLVFLVLSLFPLAAFPENTPLSLDEIVVTASRTDSPLREAPANVTVITADEIRESGAQTVADALEREPGVFPQNYLGNPKTANIDIRGYGEAAPQNVLVLVNGRRVNSPDLSGADLSQIPVDAIERIEVYRGPASVLFGDNAAAGAVNIILKAGEGPPKVTAATTVGSYNYVKPELTISGRQDKFSYLAIGSDVDTDGYRHNNAYHAKDALGNLSFDVSNNLTLRLAAGHHRDDYGLPGPLFWSDLRSGAVGPKDSTHPNDTASTEDNFFDFVPELKLTDDVVLSLGGSYRDRHTSFFYDFGSGSFSELKSQLQTYGFTPKMVVSKPIGSMKSVFVVGSDYYKYSTSLSSSGSSFLGPSLSNSDIDRKDFAYYANEKLYPFRDLILEAGYRNQRTSYDVNYADLVNPSLGQIGNSHYDKDAYRLSANYAVLEKTNVFASYAKGFRFPVTDEFVMPGYSLGPGFFVPTQINTGLKPQTTEEFDAGVRWNPLPRLAGTVTYFNSRNRDEIFYNPLTFANENYDRTKRQGLESTLFVGLAEGLGLDVAYSYTEALFDGGQFGGNRIPLVPRNKASAKLTYATGGWRFSLASVYMGDRYAISDQANAQEQLPGYTTFDGSVGYKYKRLTALFTIKNLTDKRYAEMGVYSSTVNDIALYPSPGRQFFLRLQYELGG